MKRAFIYIFLPILFMLSACGSKENSGAEITSDTVEEYRVVFGDSFENLSGKNAEELMEYFKDNGNENFNTIELNSNGNISMGLSKSQQNYWKSFVVQKLEGKEQELSEINSKFYSKYSGDYTIIDVYYDMTMGFEEAFGFIGDAGIYCAMYQMFNGSEKYTITLNVYNVDTNKLVASGNLETDDVSYGNTEWEKSYILTENEAGNIIGLENTAEDISIVSSFADGISVIDILVTAAGNNYSYLYLDDAGVVHIGLDEKQKMGYIQSLNGYLLQVKEQFESIHSGYLINYNKEFSEIEFKFDSNLGKQEQSNYFIYTETICMILQILNGDYMNYYIDINIYDSSTGALISNGNTVDGITWNIGDE